MKKTMGELRVPTIESDTVVDLAKRGELVPELTRMERSLQPPTHEALGVHEVSVDRRELQLVSPFETSFGRFGSMVKGLVAVTFDTPGGRVRGYGETTPLPYPWYDGESDRTVETVMDAYMLPLVRAARGGITDVEQFRGIYGGIVGHNMAKTGLEGAYWDAVGQMMGVPVSHLWGGSRTQVEAGTSVGLERTDDLVLQKIERAVGEMGVARVKVKIKPGRDVSLIGAIRNRFPQLRLQADGNAAYDFHNPEHMKALAALDEFGLMMIEQPGPNDDIVEHARASERIGTPICLDESILHTRHAITALDQWAQRGHLERLIVNIKPPRVGGFWEGAKIAEICRAVGVPTWCGGMLESALGKTANVQFCAAFTDLPGDHVSQGPYFVQDVATPPNYHDGVIDVPQTPGWGVQMNSH
jgi:O-succinylbenzoate synthase